MSTLAPKSAPAPQKKAQVPPPSASQVAAVASGAPPALVAPVDEAVPLRWLDHTKSRKLELTTLLHAWLEERHYVVPTGQGKSYTHTRFTGGLYDVTDLTKLHSTIRVIHEEEAEDTEPPMPTPAQERQVQEAQERQFWHVYGKALYKAQVFGEGRRGLGRNSEHLKYLFLAEKRTEIFRYYIDLDFKSPKAAPDGYPSLRQLEARIAKARLKIAKETGQHAAMAKLWEEEEARCQSYLETANHERLQTIVLLAQETLREFYSAVPKDSQQFQVLVCLTTPPLAPETKEVEGQSTPVPMQKDGVHLIFPYLFVNEEQALYLRATLVSKLEVHFGMRDEVLYNSWLDVVDEGVYRANSGGLRMLGSRKATRCNAKCNKGNKRRNFARCMAGDDGYHHENRYYWPEYLIGADGTPLIPELEALLDPNHQTVPGKADMYGPLIEMSSVRCWELAPSPGYAVPLGAPQPKMLLPGTVTGRKRKGRGGKNTGADREHKEDQQAMSRMRDKQPLPADHPWIPLLQELVRVRFTPVYKDLVVSQVIMLPDGDPMHHPSYLIRVKGPGSSYCQNISADHRSNTIYFVLSSQGGIECVQKCFCRCDKKRDSGVMCKHYASQPVMLSQMPTLASNIFPPLFHTDNHPALNALRKNKHPRDMLEAVHLTVLWNHISRDALFLNSVEPSALLDEELCEAILREIRVGCSDK